MHTAFIEELIRGGGKNQRIQDIDLYNVKLHFQSPFIAIFYSLSPALCKKNLLAMLGTGHKILGCDDLYLTKFLTIRYNLMNNNSHFHFYMFKATTGAQ